MSDILLRMDLGRPYSSVSPTLEGDVLVVLARTTGGLTGREVARLALRGSQRGSLSALERLVAQGLVTRAEAGASFQYTLNRDHLAAPAVEVLAGMRTALWGRVGAALAEWDPAPAHVSVFGSAARGDGDVASDIDVLVVRPDGLDPEDSSWRVQVAQLAGNVEAWTGNHASIAEVPAEAMARLGREQEALASNLRSDAITLAGPEVAALLDGTA